MARKFGAHLSIAGGLQNAVNAAHALGFSTVQIFTKNNARWENPPTPPAQIAAFRDALAGTGIADPVVHATYLINLATGDDSLWNKSIAATIDEVERCAALGVADLVLHPGAPQALGVERGVERVAEALDLIHERTAGLDVFIDLETTAGQGSCIGCEVEHLGAIIARVAEPERVGICCDTCHLFAAGYDFRTADDYATLMARMEQAFGTDRIRAWHLNDSAKPCGSRVDRHDHIGRGHLGPEPFRHVLNDPRFADSRFLLETPKGEEAGEDFDVINLRALLALVEDSAESAFDDPGSNPVRPPRRVARTRTSRRRADP